MVSNFLIVLVFSLILSTADALSYEGGTVSTLLHESDYLCARRSGWRFVIVRSYDPSGKRDPNVKQNLLNIQNMDAVGFAHKDIVHYPCFKKEPADQIREAVTEIRGQFDRMWIHIGVNSHSECAWSLSRAENCHFLTGLLAASRELGLKTGIVSSRYWWNSIMGPCERASYDKLPLGYVSHDGQRTNKRFEPFGGWTEPSMKEFMPAHNIESCGFEAPLSWYEKPPE